MKILCVKASNCSDVRLQKYIRNFSDKKISVSFCGWKRREQDETVFSENLDNCDYILQGMSTSKSKLMLGNFLWFIKSFLYLLFHGHQYDLIYCADLEASLPCWFAKKINRKINYIYDVYDEFALRYKMPTYIQKGIKFIDRQIRKNSKLLIHVDENRLSELDNNVSYIIIENSPFDYYNGVYESSKDFAIPPTIAVTGYLTKERGIESILKFAQNHPLVNFIIVGRFKDKDITNEFLTLKNVANYEFMPQQKLFSLIKICSGIFSLYDPTIEINLKAASNKLYDAMMLGVPVICNKEIYAADYIKKHKIGILIDYNYSKSWEEIVNFLKDKKKITEYGNNGRVLYENNFNFSKKIDLLLERIK